MAIDFLAREKSIEDVVLVDCGWPYINMPHLNLSSSWFKGIWRFGRGAFRESLPIKVLWERLPFLVINPRSPFTSLRGVFLVMGY